MNATGIVAVSLIFGTGFVAVLGGVVVKIIKTAKGMDGKNPGKGNQKLDREAETVAELSHGLAKMAQRIEALETILTDNRRPGGGK